MKSLTIGQVAAREGVGVETIRFYEREGLLKQPTRRASGYRQYDEQAVSRLRFIRKLVRRLHASPQVSDDERRALGIDFAFRCV